MTASQLSLFDATSRRDKGIHDSASRAGGEWVEEAIAFVGRYAGLSDEPFLGEEARAWAEARGLAAPTDARAWGAVMQAAQRRGLVEQRGFGRARSSNLSPKVLWGSRR